MAAAATGLVFATAASVAAAAPHVLAFSSTSHFACENAGALINRGICADAAPTHLPSRAASDLLQFLSRSRDFSAADSSLPEVASRLRFADTQPEVVLAVTDNAGTSARTLLGSVSDAILSSSSVRNPSSFASSLDGVPLPSVAGRKVALDELERLASKGGSSLITGEVDTLSVDVGTAEERSALLTTMRALVNRAEGRFAVVWTSVRAEDETEKAHESAMKGGAAGEAAAEAVEEAEAAGPKDVDGTAETANASAILPATATTGIFNVDGTLVKNTSMDPPLITTSALVGLVVTAVLLMILGPGLMCLYNIQAPQSFDYSMDRDEAKKKMQ